MSARPPEARMLACARCGALNGADFDRCIRCGIPLAAAAPPERLPPGLDGGRLLATKLLAGLTFLVLLGQVLAARAQGLGLLGGWRGVDAIRFGALIAAPGLPFEAFRLLSAVFVHGGLLHFGLNMLALSNLARIAEPAIGSARFVIVYVVTGIVGFAASASWGALVVGAPVSTVGASGAIFGVMGVILGWLLRRRDPRWKAFAVQAVLYSLVFGFLMNTSRHVRIDNAAHLGGLVSGVLLGALYAGPRWRRLEPFVNAGAIAGLLACVAALALAQRSPLTRIAAELSWAPAPDVPVIAAPRPTV